MAKKRTEEEQAKELELAQRYLKANQFDRGFNKEFGALWDNPLKLNAEDYATMVTKEDERQKLADQFLKNQVARATMAPSSVTATMPRNVYVGEKDASSFGMKGVSLFGTPKTIQVPVPPTAAPTATPAVVEPEAPAPTTATAATAPAAAPTQTAATPVAPTLTTAAPGQTPAKIKVQTPYGEIEATPEQAARINAKPTSAKERAEEDLMLQTGLLNSLKAAEAERRRPLTTEEMRNLNTEQYNKRVEGISAPRDPRINQLEADLPKAREQAKASAYLDRVDKLRANRKQVMQKEYDEAKAADEAEGTGDTKAMDAFKAKWSQIPSYINNERLESPVQTSPWFQANLNSFSRMTDTLGDNGQSYAKQLLRRANRQERIAGRKLYGTNAAATAYLPTSVLEERYSQDMARAEAQAETALDQAGMFRELAAQFGVSPDVLDQFEKFQRTRRPGTKPNNQGETINLKDK